MIVNFLSYILISIKHHDIWLEQSKKFISSYDDLAKTPLDIKSIECICSNEITVKDRTNINATGKRVKTSFITEKILKKPLKLSSMSQSFIYIIFLCVSIKKPR